MSKTKNLGQVSGVFIGMEAPKNTTLIWYDNTPSQKCHKIYDPVINGWKVLSPDIVSNTTYSELIASAKKNGLSIGKHYVITDKSNILAIAITTTKVQYFDSLGNILIDDLGVNIQYHVSSSNLLIDDINGVFDSSRNKLIFRFEEKSEIDFENDYFLSKTKNATNWILSKFKISSLLSRNTNNSISWDRGLFFSFKNAINKILNKDGGIVGYDNYKTKISQIDVSINNVSESTQKIISNANKLILENTKDSIIYGKKLQGNIDTSIVPGDIQKNDTLFTIISKFQRWINKFKTATGIKISTKFSEKDSPQYINTNDTVESALEKLQYHVKKPTGVLPEDWTEIENIKEEINMPVANDNLSTIVRKIVGKLRQLGEISFGKLVFRSDEYQTPPTTVDEDFKHYVKFDLKNGSIAVSGSIKSGFNWYSGDFDGDTFDLDEKFYFQKFYSLIDLDSSIETILLPKLFLRESEESVSDFYIIVERCFDFSFKRHNNDESGGLIYEGKNVYTEGIKHVSNVYSDKQYNVYHFIPHAGDLICIKIM